MAERADRRLAGPARAAVVGASFGFFVDMFDVYLPVVALTPAMDYFLPSSVSPDSRAIVNSLIFVATLVGRPLGSLVFGRLADQIGRRRTTLYAVTGCGVCTGLIAVLPGYAQVGMVGVALLVLLRLADGIFLGGEYAGATPLAMESVPTGRRGWYGRLVGMGFPLSYCAISLVTLLTLRIAPAGSATSPYSVWGWRVPFAIGALLCLVFVVYYARSVTESEVWTRSAKSRNPVRDVLFGSARREFVQVFVLMSGIWFASNLASGLLPSALQAQGHVSATAVTGALVIVQAVHSVLFPYLGALSERIGRRRFLAWCGVGIGVPTAAAFGTISAGWWTGFGSVLALTAVGAIMPRGFTASALLVLGGALVLVGALLGPESRNVEFDPAPTPAEPRLP